ncbi:thiol reductase thioredoxin [Mycoplasmopsis bovirhinis]|uniref:Thioredoxin n=1 Tax=Mycoplasmopsis bovirhinis TaxID=29553 RepID=A0A224AYN1_9BACT|nr:thioredoxin family protein [Mycoplasmopsis bovirhinis]BBA22163.1 thiol reductase thioredoxin [Mycoplasmopsis bovirhinis]VEU63172.1 Thioredoxin [Mycoplasmopsis bovirhinis]
MLYEFNSQQAQEAIKEGKKILVFYALWCGPCKMFKGTLEEFAKKHNIDVIRVNIEENKEFAIAHNVASIPYTELYADGQKVGSLLGYRNYDQLVAELSNFLK